MNRKFWAALMAAGALLPAGAQAQDRHERGGWRDGNRGQSSASAPSPQAAPAQGSGFQGYRRGANGVEGGPQNPGWRGQDRGQDRQQVQRQAPQQPQFTAPVASQPVQQAQPQAGARQPGQDRNWQGRGDNGAQNRGGNRNWGDNRPQQPQAPQAQQQPNNGRDRVRDQDRRGDNDRYRGRDGQRNDWQRDQRTAPQEQRGGRNNWRENRDWNSARDGGGWRNDRAFNNWNRDWRRDNRFDWQRYRYQNRNVYRLPRYYAPQNWSYGYRRFGIGSVLDQLLFGQNYWISDPWYYRLPPAYGPYRWVRYYNDALLVDTYTGEVVDVINDIFY